MAFASRAVSKRGIRDRIGITRWAYTQPTAPTIVGPQTIDLTGQAIAHGRAQGALKVNPTLLPAGQAHARAQGAPTVNPQLKPTGLTRTRGQGALTVSPQLKPAGQAHTRAQGAPAVGTVLGPAGLVHTRGQGNITISPKLFPAGQTHSRALGNPTIPGTTIRHIGDGIVVTVAYVPRPTALTRTRALGALTVTGRAITPTGQTRTRRQGNPTLSARAQPPSIIHTRGTSSPGINTLTIAPTGLAHTGGPISQLNLTAIATDTFNRANATLAGSNNWLATFDGSMAVSTNEAIGTTSAIRGDYRTETYTADQYAQAVIGTINNTASSFIGLTLRNSASGNDNYAALYFCDGPPNHLNIYKRTGGGGYSLIAAYRLYVTNTYPAGTTLRFVAEGTQLTVFVGADSFTCIDSSIAGPGAPGILSFHAVTLDSFEAGNAQTTTLTASAQTDNFNRADANMSSGQANWQTMSGYPALDIPIVSNELKVTTGTHYADVRTDSYNNDHWSQIQRGSIDVDNTGFVGLLTRINPALNSGYLGCYFGHGNTGSGTNAGNAPQSYQIYRLDTGTSVFLAAAASEGDAGGTFNPSATSYTFLSEGGRHSFRVNGKEVLAVTDNTYSTGKPGIMSFPTSTADNWAAGNLAGSGRAIGIPTITSNTILRPTGLVHARGQGNPVAHGRTIISTPALAHARAQGNPTLSARVTPAGLAHARAQGAPEINLVTLHPLALARA